MNQKRINKASYEAERDEMIQTPARFRLTKYEAFFGCFTIKVMAINKEDAKIKILNKFNTYKDGSMKKEYIRSKIEKGILI